MLSLSKLGPAAAETLPSVRELLADPDPAVRRHAKTAVDQIAGGPTLYGLLLGAIGASISDFPGPWRVKSKTMMVGFGLSIVSTSLIQLALVSPIIEIPVIGAIALIALAGH